LEQGRRLRTIAGTMAELASLAATMGDGYLKVIVREAARAGLADEVRTLFPAAVDVVVEQPGRDGRDGREEREGDARQPSNRTGRTPQELFGEYLSEQGIDDERLTKLFAELLDESHAA